MYYNPHMQYGKFASYYDFLMRDVDYNGWAAYVAGFMELSSSVLECACGTGEISLRLARMGHNVIATDVSSEMLEVAEEKMRAAGLVNRGLQFVQMDMRALSLHKKADCVLACCDGVNYLLSREDVKTFFASANSVLKNGGLLLFDVSSRYKLEHILENNSFTENGEELAYIWQNNYDGVSKLVEMELSFFVKKGSVYERFDEKHIQRAHSVRELGSWLEETGFGWEAYSFGTHDAPGDRDERIQFIARKK